MRLEIRRPVGYERIRGGVALIEGVVCKGRHIVK